MGEEKKVSKVKVFLTGLLPMILLLGVQTVVAFVYQTIATTKKVVATGGEIDPNSLVQLTTKDLTNILVCYIVISFVALLIWFKKGKYSFTTRTKKMHGTSFIYIAVWFVAVEMLASGCLLLLQKVAPQLMSNYEQLMEASGLTDFSVVSIFLTLIGAPVVEEIAFRGITMQKASGLSEKFWVANVFQALLFGITHMNLVQGTYAFFMGLALGYVAKKYKSLWASIIGHLVFNFSGTFLVALLYGSEEVSTIKPVIVSLIAVIFVVLVYTFIKKDEAVSEDGNTEALLSNEAE